MASDEDEFSELRDPDIDTVHAVGAAANGTRILFAKQAAEGVQGGLFTPGFVRGLIAKSQPAEQSQETVTMTGSPAAIAALIHNAPVRKAAEAAEAEPVAKADGEGLDPTTVLAEPDGDAPGDPADPGSPAWEAIDAATARKWTAILARACNALCTMAEREMLEAAVGDSGDVDAAFDLEDAKCAIDYAISVLAPFAVGEQAEADLGTEALAAVGKALAAFDAGQLDVVEALAPVAKAGRVLSAGNEAAIRAAAEALQKVLASLPAPVDDSGQPVAKQTQETPVMIAPATPEAPAAEVAKADTEAQVAVYTRDGALFGTVARDAVMAVEQPEAPEGAEPGDVDAEAADADTVEEAAAEPVVAPGEDAAVIPGTSTVASPAADEDEVTKAVQAGFNTALAEALKPFTEELARTAGLADVVKGLQERVEHLARMPDDRKSPLLNGADGTGAGIASRDGNTADPLAELKKAVDDAPNEAARTQAQTALGIAAIKARFAS
jgi:hypothetical protein